MGNCPCGLKSQSAAYESRIVEPAWHSPQNLDTERELTFVLTGRVENEKTIS